MTVSITKRVQSGNSDEEALSLGVSKSQTSSDVETWRAVSGFTFLYEVSSQGRIRKRKTGRLLRPFKVVKNCDTLYVDLRRADVTSRRPVHQLVAEAFLPEPLRGQLAAHRSDDVTDNRVANIEWLSLPDQKARVHRRRPGHRGPDGAFTRLEEVVSAMESAAVHETALKGWSL